MGNVTIMKKVLVTTYHFPPAGRSFVMRALKFIKYLNLYNWDPVVLTAKSCYSDSYDASRLKDLPYPDEYFDKVVCSSSLEHFKDDIKALKEMCRVLKPNGSVALTTDSFIYPIEDELKEMHRKIAYIVNYYTHEKLKERFEIAGFEMNRNKYLLSSRITSFFFKRGIELRWSGKFWMVVSFIAYPLCLVSDRLFGVRDKGYTLIVEAEKCIKIQEIKDCQK